ncbi:MAG: type I toxin-antitoxin system SymE family toxin [bacterium]|nr:type I toxin-antitoxin system SymE family toxin [bacterium]
MRSRTLDSTTAPAAAPSDSPLESPDCWVYFVTEKGLRASGAASMKAAATGLRQTAIELEKAARRLKADVPATANGSDGTAPARVFRRGTVCGRYQRDNRVPDLRLSGKWLRQAGFELGRKYQVEVGQGRLTICVEQPPAATA